MFKVLLPDTAETVSFSGSRTLNFSGVTIHLPHVNRNCWFKDMGIFECSRTVLFQSKNNITVTWRGEGKLAPKPSKYMTFV